MWNVQGLFRKLSQVNFVQFCKIYDVFSCSEIHNCSENIIKDAFPEHEVYLSKRKTLNGGGISVFVRKIFKQFVSKIDIQLDECIVLNQVVKGIRQIQIH